MIQKFRITSVSRFTRLKKPIILINNIVLVKRGKAFNGIHTRTHTYKHNTLKINYG